MYPVKTDRDRVVEYWLTYLGTPYELGGQSHEVIDCSGIVGEGLMGFGYDTQDRTADGFRIHFAGNKVVYPYKGCLAFWGDRVRATHTEIILGEANGIILCLGARPKWGVVVRPWEIKRGGQPSMGFVDPFKLKGWD